MLVAAAAMLRRRRPAGRGTVLAFTAAASPAPAAVAATTVGLLTGFFGVGGGFVIVLALGFDRPAPVGTSMLVITINSAVALAARFGGHVHLDWLSTPSAAAFRVWCNAAPPQLQKSQQDY